MNHPSTSTSTAFSRHTSEPWHRLHGPQASTSRPARTIQPCHTQIQKCGTFPSPTGCTIHRQLLPLEFRLRCMRPVRFIEQLDGPAVTTPAGATNRSRLVCDPERLPRSSRALRKVPVANTVCSTGVNRGTARQQLLPTAVRIRWSFCVAPRRQTIWFDHQRYFMGLDQTHLRGIDPAILLYNNGCS